MKFAQYSLLFAIANSSVATLCSAFVNQSTGSINNRPKISSTELYIIGPMIRKMREEKEKNSIPMANEAEREGEASGLKVGDGAWKWPPVWPYDGDTFTPSEDIKQKPQGSPLAGLLGQMPKVEEEADDEDEGETFDIMKYWSEEKANETTDIDKVTVEKLQDHYSFYLKDGMQVLELGAAENSYLPDGLKLSRHVGVGANQALMDKNSVLSESLVVNLNDVIEEQGVNSEELSLLGAGTFDAVIMANTVDFLTNPREVLRSAWGLLKPGGIMMIPFVNKEAYKNKFERGQTKMWRDYNDDQHMWVTGSLFQFSAGDGWEGLKGFDISPEGARKQDDGPIGMLKVGTPMNMFVVQARKAELEEGINPSDPERSFRSKMWLMPTLEDRDKKLLAPRLTRSYQFKKSDEDIEALGRNVAALPKVYESLVKMDQFAFTFSMQSQLAADLVTDRDFTGNDEQIKALKMGLGLRTPSPEFWAPVGQKTASMVPEDKINLLAHVVPRFGSSDPAQAKSLDMFVAGLEPTFDVIRSKCSDLSEADVQLAGTELLAAEILIPGRSSKREFATWVAALTKEEINDILETRKSYKKVAVTALDKMRKKRQDVIDEKEAQQNLFQEQIEKAREERSIALNVKTGKMELVEK